MKGLHPERTKCGIESDGAGCYSGKFLRLALPLISEITGTQILYHSTGEAQCNKSSLDGHFGVAGPAIAGVVASGKQNCRTAKDIVIAHKKTAIRSTVVREVEIDRSKQGKLDANKAMKGIPVRSIAFSKMEYSPEGNLLGVRFFKHYGFGDGFFVSKDALCNMWQKEQGATGVVLIDWHLDTEGNASSCTRSSPSDNEEISAIPTDTATGNPPEESKLLGPEGKLRDSARRAAKRHNASENKRKRVEDAERRLLEIHEKSKGFWCKRPCRHFTLTETMMRKHQEDKARCPDISTQVTKLVALVYCLEDSCILLGQSSAMCTYCH